MPMSVSALSVLPTVSQIQKLLGEEHTVRRRKLAAAARSSRRNAHLRLFFSAMLREPVALECSADRSPPPMQAFRQ